MSKQQNDFTTREQSKQLLELGVPADSANLFYSKFECETFENRPTLCYGRKYSDIVPSGYEKNYLPCWSVGRLIEIYEICTQTKFKRVQQTDNLVYLTPLEDVLMQIEHNACGFFDNTKWDTNLLK